MLIKGIIDEDFINYKLPSMNISTCWCSFKCDREAGISCCQNSELAHAPEMNIPVTQIIERYLQNPITRAIVFAGLEPFDQFREMNLFIWTLRNHYKCDDDVVIYTGYNKNEIASMVEELKDFPNIVVKFGRFIPNSQSILDPELQVILASDNQYAERIS